MGRLREGKNTNLSRPSYLKGGPVDHLIAVSGALVEGSRLQRLASVVSNQNHPASMRAIAAQLLGETAQQVVNCLVTAMADPDSDVREAAKGALRKLHGILGGPVLRQPMLPAEEVEEDFGLMDEIL